MNAAHLPDDPAALKELIAALAADVAERDSQLADKNAIIEELTEQVRLLKALRFAKSSEMKEKPAPNEVQYSLFDEAEAVVEETPEAEEPEVVQVPAHCRKKKGRKAISPDLPREEIVIDVPEDRKACPCGYTKERIGEVVSEKLYVIPQRVMVKRFIRPKYACRHCGGTKDDGPTVYVAPMPPQFIERGIVTPGLLAYILANKFCDGLPFYRQSRMFDRFGVDISRSTMSSWALQAAERCEPLLDLMHGHMRAGEIINLDETPVQVLKEPGRKNTSKSYMWVARGGGEKPVVLFRYEPSRSGDVAKEIVGDFQGYLQTDGYAGYNFLGEAPSIPMWDVSCTFAGSLTRP
jgi:transposase